MNNINEYSKFSDKALIKALELMVSRQDLKQRDVAAAILGVFNFTQEQIIDQLQRGEYVDGVTRRNALGLVKVS